MTSTYGLPRYVANFLSHMETHKDCLKWNITETSHKIHLTLTWNFRKHKGKETLWDKLQRTLKFSRSMDIDSSAVPQDLTQYLQVSPKKVQQLQSPEQQPKRPPLQRQNTWNGPQRRPFNWSKYSLLSHSLPGPQAPAPAPAHRRCLRHSQSLQEPEPPRASSVSPSRGNWTGDLVHQDSVSPRHNTPLTSTPNLTRSDSSTYSPATPSRVKLTYRTTEDLDRSMEDNFVRTRERSRVKLESIRREWNRTIRDWPQSLEQDYAATSGPVSVINPASSDSELSAENLQVNQGTVQSCLRSCDNILFRHSTDIL